MKVSVIIPSLYEKDGAYLKICVESLRATTDWDIIVVTNGTPTSPKLDHIYGITKHLHTPTQGQCLAVNIGVQVAPPDAVYILVSNSDMYYAPGWNQNLRFDYDCFSPNLIEPTNNAGSAPPFLKCDAGFTLDEFNPDLFEEFIMQRLMMPEEETTGFNLPFFIRKDVFETIEGYDENFDPLGSNSDTDFQTKVELAGIQPMRLRDVLVYHFSCKAGTFDNSNHDLWQKNWDYYKDKWGFSRDDEPKPDTWMATNLVNKEMNKYRPKWEGKWSA